MIDAFFIQWIWFFIIIITFLLYTNPLIFQPGPVLIKIWHFCSRDWEHEWEKLQNTAVEIFQRNTEERGEHLTKALINTAISMKACRGLDGKRGSRARERQRRQPGEQRSQWKCTNRPSGVTQMVGHTQKVDYEAAEEAETAGSLLSGTWPEVMLCGSSRCQGASWTLQMCEGNKPEEG